MDLVIGSPEKLLDAVEPVLGVRRPSATGERRVLQETHLRRVQCSDNVGRVTDGNAVADDDAAREVLRVVYWVVRRVERPWCADLEAELYGTKG